MDLIVEFISYFFQNITKNQTLIHSFDPGESRINLKWMLLRNSSDMTNICLFCANLTTNDTAFKCQLCRRTIHYKCLLITYEIKTCVKITEKIINDMCDLCRLNYFRS